MKPDDASLAPHDYERILKEARNVLLISGALGKFPTPVADIVEAAELSEASDDIADEGLLVRLRRLAGGALKKAASKVVGLFHASTRLIFIDRSLNLTKQTFIKLHETAHGFLSWHRDIYTVVEDCRLSLEPEMAEQFEREANVFAAAVLFQLDGFISEARDYEFGIRVPLKVGKQYGASVYASIREYVRKNPRPCAVLILDPPELTEGYGFQASLRRVEVSQSFVESCGMIKWQERFTPDDAIGAMVPLGGRKMSGKRQFSLTDTRGVKHECIAEAFTQGYQVFVLLLLRQTPSPKVIARAG